MFIIYMVFYLIKIVISVHLSCTLVYEKEASVRHGILIVYVYLRYSIKHLAHYWKL